MKGTLAPLTRATSAISASSVETTDLVEHAARLSRRDGMGDHRLAGEQADVLSRNALAAATRGNHGDLHAKALRSAATTSSCWSTVSAG